MAEQANVLEEAALQDVNGAPRNIDAVIAECINHVTNSGLVDWIGNEAQRDQAIEHVIKLYGYVNARHGNHLRTQFQDFLVFIMDCLGIPNEANGTLGAVCQNLKDTLREDLAGENSELDNAARGINRSCYGVRDITNKYSHSTDHMSEADVYELCGCFKALGAALPKIALFYEPPPAQEITNVSGDAVATFSALLENLSVPQRQQVLLAISAQQSSTVPVVTVLTPTHAPGAPLSTLPPPPQSSARGWEAISGDQLSISPVTSPQRSRSTLSSHPTQAALDAAATYQFFYDRPDEILSETGALVTSKMFRRMLNHIGLVPKATLCDQTHGHDQGCSKSHSYLEVMKYIPLYKLTVCRQRDHFWARDVAEDVNCVCVHINTGIDELAAIMKSKMTRCAYGGLCKDQTCLKSHSFEEMCWFNPHYKTTKCDPTRCRRAAIECSYAHEGERLRHPDEEDDYVGKNVAMLFIERTHKPLADALEAHRFWRSNTP